MFCNKCGNKVEINQKYCSKCGNVLLYNKQNEENVASNKKLLIGIIIIIVISLLVIGISIYFILNNNSNYYFDNKIVTNETEKENQNQTSSSNSSTKKGKYKTAIITDNVYSGITVNSIEDANELISEDSVNQKKSDYSSEIIKVENEIVEKYDITAVNLKEMDVDFAKELENVIKNIYENYPKAKGYLTNLTLTNLDMSENDVIALFRPVFTFGTSNTSTTRPWIIKTQVQLNAKYFLNPERMDTAVAASSNSGHFPKNATKYSPVAHEFGHYLSFIALLNYHSTDSIRIVNDSQIQEYYSIFKDFGNGDFSKKMLDEAYQNYIKDNGDIDFDEWRGKISQYALAKNESGDYIYDETIAEAFHDTYLNGENSNIVSKYIVEILKKYIEG